MIWPNKALHWTLARFLGTRSPNTFKSPSTPSMTRLDGIALVGTSGSFLGPLAGSANGLMGALR